MFQTPILRVERNFWKDPTVCWTSPLGHLLRISNSVCLQVNSLSLLLHLLLPPLSYLRGMAMLPFQLPKLLLLLSCSVSNRLPSPVYCNLYISVSSVDSFLGPLPHPSSGHSHLLPWLLEQFRSLSFCFQPPTPTPPPNLFSTVKSERCHQIVHPFMS